MVTAYSVKRSCSSTVRSGRTCAGKRHQNADLVGARKLNAVQNKQRLEVFFNALLGVKADRVGRAVHLEPEDMRGSLEIALRLRHPLTSDLEHLIIEVEHKVPFPRAAPAG